VNAVYFKPFMKARLDETAEDGSYFRRIVPEYATAPGSKHKSFDPVSLRLLCCFDVQYSRSQHQDSFAFGNVDHGLGP
jgi:hypothetical protein